MAGGLVFYHSVYGHIEQRSRIGRRALPGRLVARTAPSCSGDVIPRRAKTDEY
jgi:hypothetical protein